MPRVQIARTGYVAFGSSTTGAFIPLSDPRQFKEELDSCQLEVIGNTKGRPFFIF